MSFEQVGQADWAFPPRYSRRLSEVSVDSLKPGLELKTTHMRNEILGIPSRPSFYSLKFLSCCPLDRNVGKEWSCNS
jgi:hypothetical protein